MNTKSIKFLIMLFAVLMSWSCAKDIEVFTGNIMGKVTDAETGEVLHGVNVTILPSGISHTTGSDGHYEFLDLEPKQYEVQAQKSGYETNTKTVTVVTGRNAVGDIQLQPIVETGRLELSTTNLNFGSKSQSLSFDITNKGNKSFKWNITGLDNADWLDVHPTSGTLGSGKSNAVTVTLDRSRVTEHKEVTITINADTESQTLKISADPDTKNSKITLSTSTLNFGKEYNSLSFDIENVGNAGDVDWDITSIDVDWIKVTPTMGTTAMGKSSVVKVELDRSKLEAGKHSTTIIVNADGESLRVTINAEVGDKSSKIELSADTLDFGTSESTLSFNIENVGNSESVNWEITAIDVDWVKVTPTSGSTAKGKSSVVKVDLDRSKLEIGKHTTTIIVNADGESSSVTINAEKEDVSTKIELSTDTLDFGTSENSLSFSVKNVGNAGDIEWNISAVDVDWITVTPTSGKTAKGKSSVVKVELDRSKLEAGKHSTTIIVNADGESSSVTINVEKEDDRYLRVWPTELNIGTEDEMMFLIYSYNGPTTYELYGNGNFDWASFSKVEGTIPAYDSSNNDTIEEVTLYVDRTGLAAGEYSFTLIIRSDLDDYEVPVTMTVEQGASGGDNPSSDDPTGDDAQVSEGEIISYHEDLEFRLKSCKVSGTTATIEYVVENVGNSTHDVILWGSTGGYSYIYDDRGNQYDFGYEMATLLLGSDSSHNSVSATIPSGAIVKGSIKIYNVDPEASMFSSITLKASSNGYLVFKNIAIEGRSSSTPDSPKTSGTIISYSDDLEFTLMDCHRNLADVVTIEYTVKNVGYSTQDVILWGSTGGYSYIYDDQGNQYDFGYNLATLQLGSDSSHNGVSATIPSGVVVNGSIKIHDVDPMATEFSNITLRASSNGDLVFKKVVIRDGGLN